MLNAPALPPRLSQLLTEIIATAELVVARANWSAANPHTLEALRTRFDAEYRSPRSVGVLDEKSARLLDVLALIEDKRRSGEPRAVTTWRQVAGVLIPTVQEDLAALLMTEAH